MKYIVKLSVELEKIRAVSRFATAWAESFIEQVINGDWDKSEISMGCMTLDGVMGPPTPNIDHGDAGERHDALWAPFLTLAKEAYETRPKIHCPTCFKATPKEFYRLDHKLRHKCPWCDIVFDDDGNAEPWRPLHGVDETKDIEAKDD